MNIIQAISIPILCLHLVTCVRDGLTAPKTWMPWWTAFLVTYGPWPYVVHPCHRFFVGRFFGGLVRPFRISSAHMVPLPIHSLCHLSSAVFHEHLPFLLYLVTLVTTFPSDFLTQFTPTISCLDLTIYFAVLLMFFPFCFPAH